MGDPHSMVDRPLGVSLEEEGVRKLRDMSELMKSLALTKYQGPPESREMIMQPQIHIDVPNVAADLAPQFNELIDTQQEVAKLVSGLGMQGQLALENAKVQTGLLKNFEGHERRAFHQRETALHQLALTANKLGLINTGIGTANRSLTEINEGIAGVNYNIANLEDSVCKSLGELGFGITGIGNELITTRIAIVDALSDLREIFLWAHREQMWVRKQILYVLQNPIKIEAYETWGIGEKCRVVGNTKDALRMYEKSLGLNPAESRNYFSLGLIHLNLGETQNALDYFNTASTYSADEPKLQTYFLMHLAKIEIYEKHYDKAKSILENALNLDITNLEIWYDLAICCIKLNDHKKAVYYVKNLLHANPQYGFKILGNPEFAPIMERINKILRFEE
ncbi:tetratricopeptide repeat protein [Candidatus Peregrinibacteria bacterium]|nr:tetratricopeptide repeat protein [Candidatus Peregrinibacteria bacterium]